MVQTTPMATYPGMGTGFQTARHLSGDEDSSTQTSSNSRGILSSGWLLPASASCNRQQMSSTLPLSESQEFESRSTQAGVCSYMAKGVPG